MVVERVVLLAERTVETAERKDLAQLHVFEQRNAVEQGTVGVVGKVPRHILVVDKFERIHQRIRFGLNRVREVGVGEYQHGERHLVPHLASLDNTVEITEGREPEALLDTELGAVVGVAAAQHIFEGKAVREGEYRGIEVDGITVAAGLVELLVGSKTQLHVEVGLHVILHLLAIPVDKGNAVGRHLLNLVANTQPERETALALLQIGEFGFAQIGCLVVRLALQRKEYVILVGVHVLLSQLVDVVGMVQLNRVNWELTCVEFLLVEGVFNLTRIFYLLVFRTVGHISPGKPVRIELRGSDTAHPEPGSLHLVGTDGGVHGAEIEFTILAGFDITAYKYPDKFLGIVEGRYLTQPGQQFVDSALLLLHRHMAVVNPELLGLGLRIDLDPLAPLEIVDRQIIGRREREFVVSGHTPGIQPLRSRHHLELDDGIVLRLDAGTVVQLLVILFEIHVLDIVEVDVARHIQLDLLDEIGRIALGHIDMPRKTKRLGVERHKTQVDALDPVDGNRVEQIIFVKRGTDVGQGAHKAVVQQRDVVPENINFAEQVVAQHLHALLVENLVDAGPLDTGHNRLLGLGTAAIIVLGNLLLD